MKKYILLSLAVFITCSISAQKIKVKEGRESIGGANNNALIVNLYGVKPSDAEDAFRSFMKKYDGKRSSNNGEIFVDHALIKDMSNNTIDIYGKAQGKEGDKEITFVVAFNLGGAYLNSNDHKDQYKIAEQIVKDFAIKTTKDAIESELKDVSKALSKLEDAQKSLEKDKSGLEGDIEDYKSKIKKAEEAIVTNKADIKKAEETIVTNKSDQEKKKAEIEAQKKAVEEVDKRLKSVE